MSHSNHRKLSTTCMIKTIDVISVVISLASKCQLCLETFYLKCSTLKFPTVMTQSLDSLRQPPRDGWTVWNALDMLKALQLVIILMARKLSHFFLWNKQFVKRSGHENILNSSKGNLGSVELRKHGWMDIYIRSINSFFFFGLSKFMKIIECEMQTEMNVSITRLEIWQQTLLKQIERKTNRMPCFNFIIYKVVSNAMFIMKIVKKDGDARIFH